MQNKFLLLDVLKSAAYPFNTIKRKDFLVRNFGCHFHFNGKETDYETQTQDYGYRIYDYRLSRFLSVDPMTKEYPELTPYQFANNKPIESIDLDGLEDWSSKYARQALDQQGKPLVGPISAKVVEANQVHLYTDFQKKLDKLPQNLPSTNNSHLKAKVDYHIKRLAKDVGLSAGGTKALGAAVVVAGVITADPAAVFVGVSTFEIGSAMENVGTAAEITSDAINGNGKGVLSKTIGFSVNFGAGKIIDKGIAEEAEKFTTKLATEVIVDKSQKTLAPLTESTTEKKE